MNRYLLIIILMALAAAGIPVAAQALSDDSDGTHYLTDGLPEGVPAPPSGRFTGARGYYWTEIDGDTVKMIVLHDVTVFPPLKFKNKKEEEFYWRTVRDVKKTLPYAKLICATLIETYEYIETFPTQKEREEHLKRMEGRFSSSTSRCSSGSQNRRHRC